MEKLDKERLTKLCREGSAEAGIEMLRRAHRAQNMRDLEIGLAACLLCEDPANPYKGKGYLVMGILGTPVDTWTCSLWKAVLSPVTETL